MNKNLTIVPLLVLAAGCAGVPEDFAAPPLDPTRKVSEQDCSKPVDDDGGNLKCREVTEAEREAERRARLAEAERQARARREAEERAARERLEREQAEQMARDVAAAKLRAAEEERLAKLRAAEEERLAKLRAAEEAERRRQEAEAARLAQEERERKEREAAEALARERAAQAAREAAERECRRLAQEREQGRALLTSFVDNYGKVEENQEIAGQISAFLSKAPKPCPPAS